MRGFVFVWGILFALLAMMIKKTSPENSRTTRAVYEIYENVSESHTEARS